MCLVAGNAGFPRWGLVRVDQRAHDRACFESGDDTSFYVERIGIRGCWKKRLDGITLRDRLRRVAWKQAFACHGLAINRLMPSFRSLVPAHWVPQAPRRAAPPLARELAARVAVAGRTWGLDSLTSDSTGSGYLR